MHLTRNAEGPTPNEEVVSCIAQEVWSQASSGDNFLLLQVVDIDQNHPWCFSKASGPRGGWGRVSSIPQLCLDDPIDGFAAGHPRTNVSWGSEAPPLRRASPRTRW